MPQIAETYRRVMFSRRRCRREKLEEIVRALRDNPIKGYAEKIRERENSYGGESF